MVMGSFCGMALHGIGVIRGGACGCGLVVAFGYPRRLLFVVVMYLTLFSRHGKSVQTVMILMYSMYHNASQPL
jgi:hypothetical protein